MHNISNLFYFVTTLYMFRTVSPSIIRSLRLYIQHQVYIIQVLWLFASGNEMFHFVSASKQPQTPKHLRRLWVLFIHLPTSANKKRTITLYSISLLVFQVTIFQYPLSEISHIYPFTNSSRKIEEWCSNSLTAGHSDTIDSAKGHNIFDTLTLR